MPRKRQAEVLDFIRSYQRTHGITPSARAIQRHFGFSSPNAVTTHLKALAKKGALTQRPDGSWGVPPAELNAVWALPIFGAIPAGLPDEREQQADETLPLHPEALGLRRDRAQHLWGLRVTGDSMIGAHICDGDIGIFERREPRSGDIIAALVDGLSTTLKRYLVVSGRPLLRAENPAYPDIVPAESLECQGVLVGLIRRTATF